MKDTLYLSLKKEPFEAMVSDLKKVEFRVPSKWIEARLIGKAYCFVKFTNGYGSDKPWFTAKYLGFIRSTRMRRITYPNGLIVWVLPGDYMIMLGDIVGMS